VTPVTEMTNKAPEKRQPRPQRADARRNREAIVAASRQQFARCGMDAQIDDIARDAGVGVGTVYRHFPTKEDLLRALADAKFEGLAQAGREALEVDDPWEGFVQFITYGARTMVENKALSEAMDQRPELCGAAADGVGMSEITTAVIKRAQDSGQLRADIVADDVPSLVMGLGRSARVTDGRPTMPWEKHLSIILAGLRA
jgi:AcrR family transcriptional regulator